jgi:peptidoglycan/LPS O-acetylase OafA/YrhL
MTRLDSPLSTGIARPQAQRTSATRHLAGLDGLRAVAVIAVIIYHLFPGVLPGGFIGVDIFFVISGFLITSLLVDERTRAGRISLRRFWQRRARRLVPALVALVLVTCTAAWAVGGDVLVGLGRQVLGAATFSNNWLDIAGGSSYFSKDVPELFRNLWSLAVEEQFYLIWPILLLDLLLVRNAGARIGIVVALAAGSAALMWMLYVPGGDATRVYFGTGTHSFGLMIGAALALMVRELKPFDLDAGETRMQYFARRWLPAIGAACLVAVLFGTWWLRDDSPVTYRGGLVAISVITGLLIWSATRQGSRLGRMLDVAALRYVGQRSYGLYLWHWPVLVLVAAAWSRGEPSIARTAAIGFVTLVITVAASMLSYRFIEQPVRRLGFRGVGRAIRRRMSVSRRGRQLGFAWLALITVGVVGTAAALVVAPAKSSAQVMIERGERAVAKHPAGQVPSASPTHTPAPTTDAHTPTPTPTHEPIPRGDQMVAVGDSVMLASAPELQQTFPGIAIDAVVSRQMRAAPELLQAMATAGTLRKVVVVGLGTNGSIAMDTLDQIRQIIGPDRDLVLVTVQAPRDWTDGVNNTLRAFADENLRTVALADWQAAIAPHLDLLADDQIHPGASGGQIYATALQTALQHLVDAPQVKRQRARVAQ